MNMAKKLDKSHDSTVKQMKRFFSPSNHHSSTESSADEESSAPQRIVAQNSSSTSKHGSQTQTLILVNQIGQRLSTLVLRLRDVHENEQTVLSANNASEQYLIQNINEFRDMLLKNIDDFRALVLSAKPTGSSINNPDYATQEEMYRELLRLSIVLIKKMQETIRQVLDQYRQYLDDLWSTICADEDPSLITEEFQNRIEILIKTAWDPIFIETNKIINGNGLGYNDTTNF